MTAQQAETVALNGLAFLVAQPDEIERFLRNTGIDVADLRSRAADPDVLRAVLEYILAGDATTTGFCAEQNLDPRSLHAASHLLERFPESGNRFPDKKRDPKSGMPQP